MYFEFVAIIIQSIPQELHNNHAIGLFIGAFTNVITSIIMHIIDYGQQLCIDAMNKFLWIAMMLATKISHIAIPYIATLITDSEYILQHERRQWK